MLSTALSRCKIKVPDDSLINIAVDYYKTFGPAKEKFLSYYYQGRVYDDLEDYESAMLVIWKQKAFIPRKYHLGT